MLKFILKYLMYGPLLSMTIVGCQTIKYNVTNRDISKEIKSSPLLVGQFTGFSLYDPEQNRFICNYNDELYFTPASNTKILTAYACLTELGDSITAFYYSRQGDSIYLSPKADPTFLHPAFETQTAGDLIKDKKVFIKLPDNSLSKFGSGWAWDDYEYNFQTERSWLPIYGNNLRIYNDTSKLDSMIIVPEFFKDYTQVYLGHTAGNRIQRDERFNIFRAWIATDTAKYERKIPFIYSKELFAQLVLDSLNAFVTFTDSIPSHTDTLFSQSKIDVVAKMMLPSDNFLAEQLLLHCALMNGFDNVDSYRAALLKKWEPFLPLTMRWVDGSGLSRYNLITPTSMVKILEQIYDQNHWKTIETIFPIGGVSGTLKNYYKASEPYIFAKTGTLSNNHNLSGYIKTKSGRTLIFSFMNNHYMSSTLQVKAEMEKLLISIRDAY